MFSSERFCDFVRFVAENSGNWKRKSIKLLFPKSIMTLQHQKFRILFSFTAALGYESLYFICWFFSRFPFLKCIFQVFFFFFFCTVPFSFWKIQFKMIKSQFSWLVFLLKYHKLICHKLCFSSYYEQVYRY